MRHFFWTFLFYMLCQALQGQNARISGKVENERGQPMSGVNITILGRQEGTTTNDSGRFSIPVKPNRSLALVFTYQGYQTQQRNFLLNANEEEQVYLRLMPGASTLQEVVVTNTPERRESGLVRINPKLAQQSPAPIMGIENLIKVLVGSNNELSSQYNVRGGSYDENLVYVNDFEIYRPFLIRSGQQEGLSFINPALARNVNFYNGGFQARYGDKMSSVLDVQYKRPTSLGGSAYVGLLEQGAHAEGSARGGKISFLAGARNRSLRNLLSSQQTKGNYLPSSADVQTLITWQPNNRWSFEWLTNLAKTQFTLEPQESQQTISVFTPLFSANLGLDVDFYGRETDTYTTLMTGLSATRQVNPYLKLKGMLSYFRNQEQERINIGGSYLFGDREFDKASADFGLIVNPLGAGVFLDYARNRLDVQVANATLRGVYDKNNHYLQFGSSLEQNRIADVLQEFNYQDSAGYSLPYQTGPLFISRTLQGGANLNITRLTGFIQDNLVFNNLPGLTLQAGLRYNYNTLNQEFLLQPRAGVSFKPRRWKRDVIWKASAGLYHQPPFYREMRRFDGSVNTQLKAQRSAQLSAGADYAFKMLGRPFRLSTEAYYKNMWQVVPYDIDNVRLRYFGENMAKAYAYGLETRLFGELVKDAESWLSIGLMNTRENLNNDSYLQYINKDGVVISPNVTDQVPVDSQRVEVGWLRRPTDRRLNIGLFYSDYLTTNKNFRVHLQALYGSNLPYNIPNSVRYRNALEVPAYLRMDIGFTYQLLQPDKSQRRSHDPLKALENLWISLEVFNLLDRANVISYALIKDFANNTFALPNRLTPRLLNLKLTAKW